MKRKEFIKKCGLGCLGLASASILWQSCASTSYLTGTLNDSYLDVPLSAFESKGGKPKRYIIVEHAVLQYPICIYRKADETYQALLMKCTHLGTELQAFGDRLQCPAHGSEFSNTGAVQNGPADTPLRSFPVEIENGLLKINLS